MGRDPSVRCNAVLVSPPRVVRDLSHKLFGRMHMRKQVPITYLGERATQPRKTVGGRVK